MKMRSVKAGFVGFGEVNSPRELIERKCLAARQALEQRGIELVHTAPVSDDPEGSGRGPRPPANWPASDFDLLVVCLAGWIPSHSVVDVIAHSLTSQWSCGA